MTRDIVSANETASQAAVIEPITFVHLALDSGDVRVHSGLGPITFDSNTYEGVGSLGSISVAEEGSDLQRSTMSVALSGIPGDMVSIVLDEYYQGRQGTVYLGYLNTTTKALVADPFILWRGRIDTSNIKQNGATISVELTMESRFAAWDRPKARRYNNADQQSRYPGDRFFEFLEGATEKTIVWGRKA